MIVSLIVRRTARNLVTVPAIVALSPDDRPPDELPVPVDVGGLLTVAVGVDTLLVMVEVFTVCEGSDKLLVVGVPELVDAPDVVDKAMMI